jgi:hypothetical protein
MRTRVPSFRVIFDPDTRFCEYLFGVGIAIGIAIDPDSESDADSDWVAGDSPP